MDANLTQVRAFVTVARVKNFTHAARILNVSQPALTVQVKQLEETLNLKLFDRNTRHVMLTKSGRELVPVFQRLLLEFEGVVRNARDLSTQQQGVVQLGCIPSVAATYLPEIIAAFRKRNPHVSFVLRDATGRRVITMIREGEVEVGITDGLPNWPDIKVTDLYHDRIHAIFPKTHPIGKLKKITIDDLAKWPLVLLDTSSNTRNAVDAAFASIGELVTPVCEVTYASSAIGLVRAGLGISLLGSLVVRSNNMRAMAGLQARPIDEQTFVRRIGLVWQMKQALSPSTAAFADFLLQYSRKKGWTL